MSTLAEDQWLVSLGTNHNRESALLRALDLLQQHFGELLVSPVYESSPVDVDAAVEEKSAHCTWASNEADYYNAVVCFYSALPLLKVKAILDSIEKQCGRERENSVGADSRSTVVAMDIDLLFYGQRIGLFDSVTLPRPSIWQCAYILRPLADVVPNTMCPVNHQRFIDLWNQSSFKQAIAPIDFVWQEQLLSVSPPCLQM